MGRFLSVDPLTGNFPYWSPYAFAGNTPIQALDLDGLEILGYRAMFSISVRKSDVVTSYEISIMANYSLRKWNKRDLSVGYKHGDLKRVVGCEYSKEMTDLFNAYKGNPNYSSSSQAEFSSTTKKQVRSMMGIDTGGSLSGRMAGSGDAQNGNYQYMIKQQQISGKAGGAASAIKFFSKLAWSYSPQAVSWDNQDDLSIQLKAYELAFDKVKKYSKTEHFIHTPDGFDIAAFKSKVTQYLVDGFVHVNDPYNKQIKEYGEWVKGQSKKEDGTDLDLKIERKSDRID